MEKFKIVTDSSSDLLALENIPFASAPLKIITAEKEFVDNEKLDVGEMVEMLSAYKGRSSTSCPNPEDWLEAFGDAENVFCVTITGALSGCYNSATVAKAIYEEKYPQRKVFVLDSLSTGPQIKLIVEKTEELIACGYEYEEICKEITQYAKKTGLIFMLESMKNLANNGRVNPIVAKAVGILGIRIVGRASDAGELQPLDKARGEERALISIVKQMKEQGFTGNRVRIAHCFNSSAAQKLTELILKEFKEAEVQIYGCKGLCSFYAQKGGLLVGFEKEQISTL